jgi:hypothetical protein
MNGPVHGAGWPFAWFLHSYAAHADSALQSGVVSKNDRPGRLQVRKPDGATDVIEVDCARVRRPIITLCPVNPGAP